VHGLTTRTLEGRFAALSPRLNRKPFTAITVLLHGGALLALVVLTMQAFMRQGLFAWAPGLVYIAYDTALILFVAVETWGLRKHARSPEPPPGERPTLAVLVAAHNEQAVIVATVEALMAQADPPDSIVIADDGSTDATAQVLADAFGFVPPPLGEAAVSPRRPGLVWLRLPHGGKARALNRALETSDCEVVLTVDADTHLDPGAIAAMRAAFAAEPELVAATGVLTPVCDHSLQGRIFERFQRYEYVRNFISRHAWEQVNSLLLISGAFAAFRREAVVEVGGFDPECFVEDYELIHRLHRLSADRARGWTVRAIGRARARTDAPARPLAFIRQRRRWFGGFLQTQFWNRDMVGSPHYGRLGTMMLPVKALDTVQPLYGLTAFALLIGFAALGKFPIVVPILLVMLGKVVVDLAFHFWFIGLYDSWTGETRPRSKPGILMLSLAEPVSFQLLRHVGAVCGWHAFLTGAATWGRQDRRGLIAMQTAAAAPRGD
jgi:cellulose synthase/poly-beta-1,6-N-acetylglucosamine synthase-like glycosyltransferase